MRQINNPIIDTAIEDLKNSVDNYISCVSRHNYDAMEKAFNHAKATIDKEADCRNRRQYITQYADIYCGDYSDTTAPYFFETDSYTVCLFDTTYKSVGYSKKYRAVDNLHAIFQFIRDIDDGEYNSGEYIVRSHCDSDTSDYRDKQLII